MADRKTLTFALMDPPYENARTTTALRLIDIAVRRGFDVNVFAYEGAVNVPFAKQAPHANAVHGRDVGEEDHPNPKDWVAALFKEAEKRGSKIDWVQCGLCVDERGATEWVPGPRRGSPADLVKFAESSDNTLVIPTK
ncbi:MAG: DsrE family protein [Acidobacteria bacterium]|nr:DsrE family protein [Acidobacteriota bacterium]